MSLSRALEEALDKKAEGTVSVRDGEAQADIEVVATGPVGVRVRRLKVARGRDVSIEQAAAELPDQLARVLPERVGVVEVDGRLGGAVFRTRPEEMRGPEFLEVEVRGTRGVDVRRWRVGDQEREPVDWAMTRDQLGRLLDELG